MDIFLIEGTHGCSNNFKCNVDMFHRHRNHRGEDPQKAEPSGIRGSCTLHVNGAMLASITISCFHISMYDRNLNKNDDDDEGDGIVPNGWLENQTVNNMRNAGSSSVPPLGQSTVLLWRGIHYVGVQAWDPVS